jgi:TolB-like protein
MKRTLLAMSLALLGAFAFTQEQPKIAVFPFEDMDNLLTRNESVFFYRQFSNEFTNKNNGRFRVIPRQDVEKLINTEAKFQLSEFSAQEKTAEMRRVLNGTQILSGLIGRVGNRITISLSLYTFPDLEQLPGGVDMRVANKDELFDKIPELVQMMMTAIAGGGATYGNRPPPPEQTYKIGDTGPAGGIIFFDRGFTGDGWRYLEAAPAGAEFTAEWGACNQNVSNTITAVGFGKQNTKLIVDRLRGLGETNKATQICTALDINGYKDWFLPSKDELNLMYTNLKQKGLGGFSNSWYWSSSQPNNSTAWLQRFSDGSQHLNYASNDTTFSVRAVRAF